MIDLPLSIYIVNLQNKAHRSEDLDASCLEEKCKFLFERGNRKFLRLNSSLTQLQHIVQEFRLNKTRLGRA